MTLLHYRTRRGRHLGAALTVLLSLAGLTIVGVRAAPAALASQPSGYLSLPGWSVGSASSSAHLPANAASAGAVRLTHGAHQNVAAAAIDGATAPRLTPNAAAITAAQHCLSGHVAAGGTNACASFTATVTLPRTVVNPVLAFGLGGGGWSSGGVCSADWEDVTVSAIDRTAPTAGRVSAVSLASNETFSGSTLALSRSQVLSQPCSSPTANSTAYLRLNGTATTVALTFTLRAETTANPGASTPGISSIGGVSLNLAVPGADLAVTNSAPDLVAAGAAVTWRLAVRNTGPLASHGLIIRDAVPSGVTHARIVSAPAGCRLAGGAVACSVTATGCTTKADAAVSTLADVRCASARDVGTVLAAGSSLRPIVLSGHAPTTTGGVLTDRATVAGVDVDPDPADNAATATTVVAQSTLLLHASVSPATVLTSGTAITYNYVVTNDGSVGVSGLTIVQNSFGGTNSLPAAHCPTTSLAPGASTTCSARYVTSAADVTAGTISSTTSATAAPVGGGAALLSNSASADVVTSSTPPTLTLVESVDRQQITAAEQTAHYRFAVTNRGRAPVTDLVITDVFDGVAALPVITCPTRTLRAGQRTTCSTTFTATLTDLTAANRVDNTAVATATTTSGDRKTVLSNLSSVRIAIVRTPLSLSATVTTPDGGPVTGLVAGESVAYRFRITNTGTHPVGAITIRNGAFSGAGTLTAIDCPTVALAPMATVTCTASYIVTAADVARGNLVNNAVATGLDAGSQGGVGSAGSTQPQPGAAPSPRPAQPASRAKTDGGLNGGDIAAIALGAVALVAALGAVVSAIAQRRRRPAPAS